MSEGNTHNVSRLRVPTMYISLSFTIRVGLPFVMVVLRYRRRNLAVVYAYCCLFSVSGCVFF